MTEKEKVEQDWINLSAGQLPARETAYLYMEKYKKLLERMEKQYVDLQGQLMYKEIQIDRLIDRLHYVLNEAEGKGLVLDERPGWQGERQTDEDDAGESSSPSGD